MIELPEIPSGCNVVGIGIDQIEVDRIQESIDQHGLHFLSKIFTEEEQNYCRGMANPAPHYAARFAAKEAVSKAFGTGLGKEFGWLDSAVTHGLKGQPIMNFSGKGTKLLQVSAGGTISCSVSRRNIVTIALQSACWRATSGNKFVQTDA